jgi:ribose transport system substrate-binding protein
MSPLDECSQGDVCDARIADVTRVRSAEKIELSPRYRLETVARACAILREFEDDQQMLSLNDIVKRTGLERTICFRLLHTLEQERFLRRGTGRRYASNIRLLSQRRFRIAYASQTMDSFSSAVGQGLRWAASEHQVDLIEIGNHYSAKTAVRNAEALIKQRVDLVIEFQVYDRIGAQLSGLFEKAGISVIALEIPHPGATFFGVDNYKVGVIAGRALQRAAQRYWDTAFDELLLLEVEIAGSLPHLRLTGAQSVLCKQPCGPFRITHLESRGEFLRSFELTRKYLQTVPKRRTLITGINDFAVLGALRAFDEAGRRDHCLAVGLAAIPEARQELRLSGTRLVASVGFFPERYGSSLIRLALDVLQHKSVPPAVYAPVELVTQQNVDRLYPRDLFPDSNSSKQSN